ncbi:MAG: PD40 domain-containing protein [Anaerolineales bacterium]|nr:MAG: PD40 domain-containing protein [Anaerolineales bacterium]
MDDGNLHAHSTMVGPSIAPTLEIVRGNEQGKTIRLKLTTRIGRERDNDVVLTDPRVSRYHTLIELVEGRWAIKDLESANGTFVNGEPISDVYLLEPDDRIVVGDTELAFQPSRVGLGAGQPAQAPRPRKLTPAQAPPDTSPRWGKAWIAGGLVLAVALVGMTLFAFFGFGGKGDQPPAATTDLDEGVEGYVLVYEDDFSDPSSGWDDAFDRYTTKQYGNNKYYIDMSTSNLVAWGLANRKVSDFRLEVDAAQESGPNNNGYGILFRFQDRDNFYRFDISGDGFFLLSKFHNGEWVTLIPWTASSAVNVGQAANRLFVEAIGSQIRVYVNEALLAEVKDDAFTEGNFGFFASTFSEPNLTVSFDDIKLWTPKGEALAIIPTVTPTRSRQATPTVAEVALESEAISSTETPARTESAKAEATATLPASPTVTPTPEPLPGYVSRDLPPARNAAALTGRLVFPVFDATAGTYNIFSANPDGSDRALLVSEASQPALSANGQRIAFRSWKADERGLIERATEGGDTWRFNTFFESARPTFAPDGQTFLFHSREAGEAPAVYRTTGAEYRVLRRDGAPIQGEAPAWAPDGDRFVYKGCLNGSCGVILSNLDGSAPFQLTFDPSDANPAVSPDGELVVFMSHRGENWDVYSVGIDGTGLTRLTTDIANDGLPTWAPDGKTIAFVSDRDGAWAMWVANANGKNQRPLFDLEGSIDGQVEIDVQNAFGWLEERIVWSVDGSDTQ